MTNTPLKQRLRCVSCFINKQQEPLVLLPSYFCWLAGSLREQRLRRFNSKDFMSNEKELEIEILKSSVYKGKRIALNDIELQIEVSGIESPLRYGRKVGVSEKTALESY